MYNWIRHAKLTLQNPVLRFDVPDRYSTNAEGSRISVNQVAASTPAFNESGEVLDLSELRFTFNYHSAAYDSPDYAVIKVYNMDPNLKKIKEYSRCVLEVGYRDTNGDLNYAGILIDGTIKNFRFYREETVNTVFEFLIVDNDEFYNTSWIAESFKNMMQKDVMKSVLNNLGKQLKWEGDADTLKEYIRTKTIFMPSRYYMQQIRSDLDMDVQVDEDVVTMIERLSSRQKVAYVMNRATGMIERPKQTLNGIEIKCLINPIIRVNSTIQIDNASIDRFQWQSQYGFLDESQWLQTDGYYRVMNFTAEGDSRGQTWYMHLFCAGIFDPPGSKVSIPDWGWNVYGTIK